jgi:hypothetical protein
VTDSAAYEDKVADFFKSLGYDVKIRHSVHGARATRKIDVWVTFEIHGRKERLKPTAGFEPATPCLPCTCSTY